jgi:hypothetical protein
MRPPLELPGTFEGNTDLANDRAVQLKGEPLRGGRARGQHDLLLLRAQMSVPHEAAF